MPSISEISEKSNVSIKKGVLEVGKDIRYEGELHNGKRHGYGRQKWKEGTIYEGQWKNDLAEGRGALNFFISSIFF